MTESIVKHTAKTTWVMVIFAIICTFTLALIHWTTKVRIQEAEASVRMNLFSQILPAEMHDNDLIADAVKIKSGGDLGNRDETLIHRARLNHKPSAIILETTAPDGYSGDIRLLIAIKSDGEVIGVRVLEHRETPGLGDYIDLSHSDWIKHFDKTSLTKINDQGWQVKKDGGAFDFVTGATITPRAVIKAVHQALKFFQNHQQDIFIKPSGQTL
jgi:Na+-translocating ferredoxin:NAD+ oxidoreductase subunit G